MEQRGKQDISGEAQHGTATQNGAESGHEDADGDRLQHPNFTVQNSSNIAFTNSLFDGDVAQGLDPADDGFASGFGLQVSFSSGVTVEQSEIRGFYKGLSFRNSSDVVVADTDIHSIRSDGINFSAIQGGQIIGNHIHDFEASTYYPDGHAQADHRDMIQIFSAGRTVPSTDLVIADNRLDIGDGDTTQGIWIRNEAVDQGTAGDEMFYRNLSITNNLIINGAPNGIGVGETHGLTVSDNTILPAPGTDWAATPQIRLNEKSTAVVAQNNVVKDVKAGTSTDYPSDWTVSDTLKIQTTTPGAEGYLDDLVIYSSGATSSYIPRPGGVLDTGDIGSDLLALDETPDDLTALAKILEDGAKNRLNFNATLSAGPDGLLDDTASYSWDFGNGQTAEGAVVSHVYGAPGVYTVTLTVETADGAQDIVQEEIVIDSPQVFAFDGATGQAQRFTAGDPTTLNIDLPLVETGDGGQAIRLANEDASAQLPKAAFNGYYGASGFSLDLSLRMPEGSANAGQAIRLHKAMMVQVNGAGEVRLELTPDGASKAVSLKTAGAGLQDGFWHDVQIRWNGVSGELQILVDDQVRAETSLEGVLKPYEKWAPTVGSPWHKSFTGEIREISLLAEPHAYETVLYESGNTQHAEADPVDMPDAFLFDGSTGTATRYNDGAATVMTIDLPLVETGDGGQAIKMAKDAPVTLPQTALSGYYGASGFDLNFEIRMDEGRDNAGEVLRIHHAMIVHVTSSGEVRLQLKPDGADSYIDVRTVGAEMLDGGWHDVAIQWDGLEGSLQILVNGAVFVDE
ncbi:MAG: PKD domain-containing protein, partial [Pseudomonadota bacterium]